MYLPASAGPSWAFSTAMGAQKVAACAAVLRGCAARQRAREECLEANREQPGFSAACKTEVEKMMETRASDFRLDPKLRQLCADDIQVTHL